MGTGRRIAGFVMVVHANVRTLKQVRVRVALALKHVGTLPENAGKAVRKSTRKRWAQ